MKIKDLLKLTNDAKLYIEIIDIRDKISYGIFRKNDLIYSTKYHNDTIKNISVQYFENKRILILEVE